MEIRPTKTQENKYYKDIVTVVLKPLQKSIVEKLAKFPSVSSAWEYAISSAFDDDEYNKWLDSSSEKISTDHIEKLNLWQQKKYEKQIEKLYGISIGGIIDGQIDDDLDIIISANLKLIKSIPRELNDQIDQEYRSIISSRGFDQSAIMSMLSERFAVAQSRSRLIATDQTNKTIGALAKLRQRQSGVTKFLWRSSEDSRVRPSHQLLNNQIFEWTSPPAEGIPGEPIRCRCVALPYIDNLSLYRTQHNV